MYGDYYYYPHSGDGGAAVLGGIPSIEPQDDARRRIVALDPGPGERLTDAHDVAPATGRPFQWKNYNRAQTAELLFFIDDTQGRAQPFWMPSYQRDLVLTANAAAGATAITVQAIGYTTRLFPVGNYRKHLCFMAPNQTLSFAQVHASVDNGNGTETLTLEDPLAEDVVAGVTMVSFLRYVRLEDDELTIEFEGTQLSTCQFSVRELPLEVGV
jgi:hypothetical protein